MGGRLEGRQNQSSTWSIPVPTDEFPARTKKFHAPGEKFPAPITLENREWARTTPELMHKRVQATAALTRKLKKFAAKLPARREVEDHARSHLQAEARWARREDRAFAHPTIYTGCVSNSSPTVMG